MKYLSILLAILAIFILSCSDKETKDVTGVSDITNCSNPVMTPAGGTYYDTLSVTLTSATGFFFAADTTNHIPTNIYYTLDGTDPNEQSSIYDPAHPIRITNLETTIKAKVVREGLTSSPIITHVYKIACGFPIFFDSTPEGATYTTDTLHVQIKTPTPGATIYYTMDGSDPTTSDSVYTSTIILNQQTTVMKAKVVKPGSIFPESAVISKTYKRYTEAPKFEDVDLANTSNDDTFYNTPARVKIVTLPGVVVRYTTDGSTPTETSTIYDPALEIPVTADSTKIIAQAYKNGSYPSLVATKSFYIKIGAPGLTDNNGAAVTATMNNDVTVKLSTVTTGAVIRYTLSNYAPVDTSRVYTDPIPLTSQVNTIKAIAFKDDLTPSAMMTRIISYECARPAATPAGTNFNQPQSVTLSCDTNGAELRYTTDGKDPTETSTLYSSSTPIVIGSNLTLRVKAFKPHYKASAIYSSKYVFITAKPEIAPADSAFSTPQDITISCPAEGAVIRYTLDGTAPTSTSPIYDSAHPLDIQSTTTIKAIAAVAGMGTSAVAMRRIVINSFVNLNTSSSSPGSFMMGESNAEYDAVNKHNVTLTKNISISKYEITLGEYKNIMGTAAGADRKMPIVSTWFDAVKYCNKRSIAENKTPCYTVNGSTDPANWGATFIPVCDFVSANGYRLLTEAEWEFAAKGGKLTTNKIFSGNNLSVLVAWGMSNSSGVMHNVGTLEPNELGIYDMSGNANEWCYDVFANYSASSASDPIGPNATSATSLRVLRGGYYAEADGHLNVASRIGSAPTVKAKNSFRICIKN